MKPGRIVFVAMLSFVAVVMLVGAYAAAYLLLSDYRDWRADSEPMNYVDRNFGQQAWAATFFKPAAAVESRLIGCPVHLYPPIATFDPPKSE